MFGDQYRWSVLVTVILTAALFASPAAGQQRGAPAAPPGPTMPQAMASPPPSKQPAEALQLPPSRASTRRSRGRSMRFRAPFQS